MGVSARAEIKQAPDGAPVLSPAKQCCRPLAPVFELPGFELPWRQRLDPPLHPSIRRPVAETRLFLDFGFDDAPHDPATALARRLADHIDEFRLVGHFSLPAKRVAYAWPTRLLPTP